MVASYQPQESGADGGTDVRNPAKSVSYYSAVCLLQPKASREGDIEAITHTAPTSSEQCTSPFVYSSSLVTGSFISSEGVDSTERSTLGSLYVHPFAHPSARSIYSEYSPPDHWTSTSTPFATSSLSLSDSPPRPPSSASFIKMGKRPQDVGHRWGRSVSDGFPQMIRQARKGGSRLWRSLTRPSLFSSPDKPKDVGKSLSAIFPTRTGRPGSSVLLEQFPPRPAPYFYPRHVGSSVDPGLGQTPATTYPSSSSPALRYNNVSAGGPNTNDSGYGEEDDRVSCDSAEIESWKENRTDYIPTISEIQAAALQPSLRQRLGSSLVSKPRSNSPPQLRYVRSELDLSQFDHKPRAGGDVGPGVNDDPFAVSAKDLFTSSHAFPLLSRTKTVPAPLSIATKSIPTQGTSVSNSGRRSYTRTRLDSIGRPKPCIQQSASSTLVSSHLSISIPPSVPEWNETHHSPDSVSPSIHEPTLVSSPGETPLLTPDRPSFSPGRGTFTRWDNNESPYSTRKSDASFPTLDTPEKSFSRYEDNALEEGTSQDAVFYEGITDLSGVNSDFATVYGPPRASLQVQQLFPVERDAVTERDGTEPSENGADNDDLFTVNPDLASLTEDWPLPPRRTLFLDPIPGMSWQRVSPEVEYFKPGSLDTSNRRLRVVGHSTSYPNISALAENQVTNVSRLLQHVKSEPDFSSLQQLSFSSVVSVVAILGDTVLDNTYFPSTIVIQPFSTSKSPSTLFVRATSCPSLISFCALHGETSITASPSPSFVHDIEHVQAHVRLCQGPKGSPVVEETMSLAVGIQHVEPPSASSLYPFEYSLSTFPIRLPITLGELAILIAKRSFGPIEGTAPTAHEAPQVS